MPSDVCHCSQDAGRKKPTVMATALRGIVEIIKPVKREQGINEKMLVSAVSGSNGGVRIYDRYHCES
jgi:hypothetical protein